MIHLLKGFIHSFIHKLIAENSKIISKSVKNSSI